MKYRVVFTVDVDALDGREAETKAREAVEGFPTNNEQVNIAVKRPAYGCLRCFRLSEAETCTGCGGLCEEILDEPNSVLPKET